MDPHVFWNGWFALFFFAANSAEVRQTCTRLSILNWLVDLAVVFPVIKCFAISIGLGCYVPYLIACLLAFTFLVPLVDGAPFLPRNLSDKSLETQRQGIGMSTSVFLTSIHVIKLFDQTAQLWKGVCSSRFCSSAGPFCEVGRHGRHVLIAEFLKFSRSFPNCWRYMTRSEAKVARRLGAASWVQVGPFLSSEFKRKQNQVGIKKEVKIYTF